MNKLNNKNHSTLNKLCWIVGPIGHAYGQHKRKVQQNLPTYANLYILSSSIIKVKRARGCISIVELKNFDQALM